MGKICLLDPDRLEETNLNRVVGATAMDVGRPKVEVAADLMLRINPKIKITALTGNVLLAREARPLLSCDVLFCCTDSHGSRAVVNQLAYQYLIPTFDLGLRIDVRAGKVASITGRVQMLAPGLPCQSAGTSWIPRRSGAICFPTRPGRAIRTSWEPPSPSRQ